MSAQRWTHASKPIDRGVIHLELKAFEPGGRLLLPQRHALSGARTSRPRSSRNRRRSPYPLRSSLPVLPSDDVARAPAAIKSAAPRGNPKLSRMISNPCSRALARKWKQSDVCDRSRPMTTHEPSAMGPHGWPCPRRPLRPTPLSLCRARHVAFLALTHGQRHKITRKRFGWASKSSPIDRQATTWRRKRSSPVAQRRRWQLLFRSLALR